jgi:predicted nucleic acid-binding protein
MSTSTIEELPAGHRVFLDASIFLYHFFGRSEQCRHLLHRCERREVFGVTSVVTLNETSHRLMAMEAVQAGLVSPGGVPAKLRRRPDVVRGLRRHVEQLRCIVAWGIEVLPVDVALSMRAAGMRAATGLLTNDSIILATMREERVSAIATADSDFARVEGIHIYRATDLGLPHQGLA